ncbi:Glutathione S-transferase 1 [Triticum urartu]|uniref:glutathione transferase n=1 Tax=Triticum urartu TaxID=4572 RepID=M7ZE90_TRIUA|nr:Glutathione S-transferase 1 [Triticum urartu]
MALVKLYGMTMSWNVTRCVAALEEAGVEYDVVPIDFGAGEHKTPDHLARNPFGQMPVLQDGDFYVWVTLAGCGRSWINDDPQSYENEMAFESRAICKYTCRKNKPELLKEGNLKESTMVDVWLEVEAHQYTAALEPIILECLVRPMFRRATDQKTVEDNLVKLKKVLEVYEARLTKCKYLAGDFLSLADLNHVSATACLAATPYASLFDAYPHVKAWWSGLMARPSVQMITALKKPYFQNSV